MRIGLLIFPTDRGIQPVELAREAEARGFDSLWFPEHSHIPTSRRTPWGGREGAPPLPEEYWRTHDQFLALAAAAAVTSELKLGTGITLVAQRDPIWLAKEVATLDHLSNGRVLFGVGYGWNIEEMEHHGVDPKRRRKLVREKVLACKALWTQDEASFHGELVDFESSWSWPKPVQQPHPPIVIGASPTDLHFSHVIEYADAWMPIEGRWPIADEWRRLQAMAAGRGRDPSTIRLGVFGAAPTAEHLAELRELGTSWVVRRSSPTITADLTGGDAGRHHGDPAVPGPTAPLIQGLRALPRADEQVRVPFVAGLPTHGPSSLVDLAPFLDLCPLPTLVYALDDYRVLAANQRAAEFYGWSIDELCAMTALDVRPPEERQMFLEVVTCSSNDELVGRSGRPLPVARHHTRSGEVVEVCVASQAVVVDGIPARLAFITDLTWQRRAERRRDVAIAELMALGETIRSGVATRLHDGPVQVLTAASLRAGLLRRRAENPDDPQLAEIEGLITRALQDIRREMDEQRAPLETSIDVSSALGALVARREWQDRLHLLTGGLEPSPAMLEVVYRTLQDLFDAHLVQPGTDDRPNAIVCHVSRVAVGLQVPVPDAAAALDAVAVVAARYRGTVADVRMTGAARVVSLRFPADDDDSPETEQAS
jgi:probable F420-dependent oxidoreductase